eukprot:4585892-Pyramimonas_sp.AAC.2
MEIPSLTVTVAIHAASSRYTTLGFVEAGNSVQTSLEGEHVVWSKEMVQHFTAWPYHPPVSFVNRHDTLDHPIRCRPCLRARSNAALGLTDCGATC